MGHRLSLELNTGGPVARCSDVEIEVPRKVLGKPAGTLALYVSNVSAQPVVVELRGFEVEQ